MQSHSEAKLPGLCARRSIADLKFHLRARGLSHVQIEYVIESLSGDSYREIANRLCRGVKAIKFRDKAARDQLNIETRMKLMSYCFDFLTMGYLND